MSTLLYRLGRACSRRRGLVSAVWAAVLAVVVALLVTVGGQFDDEFTIPGSESQTALDQLRQASPAAAGASAQLVFVAPEGETVVAPGYAAAISEAVAAAGRVERVVFLALRGEERVECCWPVPLELPATAATGTAVQLRLIADDGYEGPLRPALGPAKSVALGPAARRRSRAS